MRKSLWVRAIICALVCLLLGSASGFSTRSEIENWYQYLAKPPWTPPNYLFGPVWTVLYILMGISLALVLDSNSDSKRKAVGCFAIQFMLNLVWSFIFFKQHAIGLALIDIIALLLFILITIIQFYSIKRIAAFLMVPYLLWVGYATSLNAAILVLN